MVLPVQLKSMVPQGVTADPELAHSFRARGEGINWVFPPEIEEIVQRSPGVNAQINGLQVQVFLQAEVNRIGEPLYGQMIRLGGLTGADVAIIPVQLEYGEGGAYILRAAVLGTRTGRVSWYGVLEGEPGEPGDPATLASVTEKLARVVLPFG